MNPSLLVWILTVAGLATLLGVDLLASRRPHEVGLVEAVLRAFFFVGVAMTFGAGLWVVHGGNIAGQYFAGYLVEESLSIDNLFVFVLIFAMFAVPAAYQAKVLLYGIAGALVLRAAFIAGGVALLDTFGWVIYAFGAFLVVTGVQLARHRDGEPDLGRNPVLRGVRRFVPTTASYDSDRLLTRVDGRTALTPLALVFVTIATTDVLFAVDSIPAVFGVTREPYLVFTSNAFALVGLRSLYFLLAGAVAKLRYLKVGLAAILVFVGAKMLAESVVHVPTWLSLVVIVGLLAVTAAASLLWPEPVEPRPDDRDRLSGGAEPVDSGARSPG
jgi:tellurite resistance protein TerC